ncbi:MAG: thioredoxin domain-containing protein [Planctomycetota bacterium]
MPNRLADESSPYLLQHKDNPVDWYPWGEEALQRAVDEDKPIFLSIGYSACHWCHVMEHESFENEDIARILNENFINIKVDREERPDLDHIYMNAVMALRGGGGGWPLSVFLTPSQQVFFGGTYWPPRSRPGTPGFDHVLASVLDAFTERRDQVETQSGQITDWLNSEDNESYSESIDETMLTTAALMLENHFDYENGGFGTTPKFPHSMDVSLLINVARRWPPDGAPGREGIMRMVNLNLKKMALGGIYDHLGGGFARYSVDEKWLVPHFEKMLYDNALLADVYLDAVEVTGSDFYRTIAEETLDYILNYLTDEQGGFYSTEDADSEGEEGKFYVWSKAEIEETLDAETAAHFCKLYGVTPSGNFEGHNILNMEQTAAEYADDNMLNEEQFVTMIRHARRQLLELRDKRVRPGLDDKVLVSWNGLAIKAMAHGGVVLDDDRYIHAAVKAAEFILTSLRRDDGRLLHTWRNGTAKLDAYLDDYSFLIAGLIELHQATQDAKWIDAAVELADQMIEHFDSGDHRGFYFTADDHEQLIARTRTFQDSSIPSGNSMAAYALLRLGRLLGRNEFVDIAYDTIAAAVSLIRRSPLASGQMLCAMERLADDPRELVLVCATRDQLRRLLDLVRAIPVHDALLVAVSTDRAEVSENLQPVLAGKVAVDEEPTLYVCTGHSCQEPVVGREAIEKRLLELQSDVKPIGNSLL